MKDTNEKYKDLMIFTLVIIVIIVLLLKNCSNNSGGTTVTTDTVFIEVKQDTSYIPKLDTVYRPTNTAKFKWDTIYLEQLPDTIRETAFEVRQEIWDYYSTRIYKDTIRHQYGNITLIDTVSQNQFKGRGRTVNLSVPIVTRTVTLTQPKRNQVYIGANLLGNETDVLKGYNINLSLKTKRDRMIEVGYNQFFGGEYYYSLGLKWKLSFRKQ